MSGDLEELLLAIGTFNTLRIQLCETPHCQFLNVRHKVFAFYQAWLILCKNLSCCSCSEMCEERSCLLCRTAVRQHEGLLIFFSRIIDDESRYKCIFWLPSSWSGLWNRWGDSEPNHGESVRDRFAGHPSRLQETLRALAALCHWGNEPLYGLNSDLSHFALVLHINWKTVSSQGIRTDLVQSVDSQSEVIVTHPSLES